MPALERFEHFEPLEQRRLLVLAIDQLRLAARVALIARRAAPRGVRVLELLELGVVQPERAVRVERVVGPIGVSGRGDGRLSRSGYAPKRADRSSAAIARALASPLLLAALAVCARGQRAVLVLLVDPPDGRFTLAHEAKP